MRPRSEAQRRHIHGRIRPMHETMLEKVQRVARDSGEQGAPSVLVCVSCIVIFLTAVLFAAGAS